MLQMEIPDAMIDTQTKQMADDFAQRIAAAGTDCGAVLSSSQA